MAKKKTEDLFTAELPEAVQKQVDMIDSLKEAVAESAMLEQQISDLRAKLDEANRTKLEIGKTLGLLPQAQVQPDTGTGKRTRGGRINLEDAAQRLRDGLQPKRPYSAAEIRSIGEIPDDFNWPSRAKKLIEMGVLTKTGTQQATRYFIA